MCTVKWALLAVNPMNYVYTPRISLHHTVRDERLWTIEEGDEEASHLSIDNEGEINLWAFGVEEGDGNDDIFTRHIL